MKRHLLLLTLSLWSISLFAQKWEELYDSTDECWGNDWQTCLEIYQQAAEAAKKEFGDTHVNYVQTINELGICYAKLGRHEASLPLVYQVLSITEQTVGKGDPNYGEGLSNLGRVYMLLGEYDSALVFLTEALENAEQYLGKQHAFYGSRLTNLGALHLDRGEYELALPLMQEALAHSEATFGKEHLKYGQSLNNLALLYQDMGQYEPALPLMQAAMENVEQQLGKQHPQYGNFLNSLGRLYMLMGRYVEALPCFQEAVEISANYQGKQHADYGVYLTNLGNLYQNMGQYDLALPYLEDARQNTELSLGKAHPHYGDRLNNLAALYEKMGQYEKALPFHQEALQNTANTLGKQHPSYGLRLLNIATYYQYMGQYEEARDYCQQALDNTAQNLGKHHREYALRLSRLGLIYQDLDQYDMARALSHQALDLMEAGAETQHPFYGTILNNLGLIYRKMAQTDTAILYFQQALDHCEHLLGTAHPTYGVLLFNMGLTYQSQTSYSVAAPYFEKALEHGMKTLGEEHPFIGDRLFHLAISYQHMGQVERSYAYHMDLFEALSGQLLSQFDVLSDRLQSSLLQKKLIQFDQLASFGLAHPEFAELHATGFDTQVLLKGFLQLRQSDLLETLRTHPDSLVQQQYLAWEHLHNTLAIQYQKPMGERTSYSSQIEKEAERLEVSLANLSLNFRRFRKRVNWKDVQATLAPGEAAIEFAHFPYYNGGQLTDSILYVAYVLRSTDSLPHMIPLFEQQELQRLISSKQQVSLDRLYASRGLRARRSLVQATKLVDLIWHPIDSLMSGVKRIYYSPSGLLHRINLGAIALNKKTYLGDTYELVLLGSTRSLALAEEDISSPKINNALLLGGIDYRQDIPMILSDAMTWQAKNSELEQLSIVSRGGSTSWNELPGTEVEVQQIGHLLRGHSYDVDLMTGPGASETSIRSLSSFPDILHIATHGYFFPDPENAPRRSLSEINELSPMQLSDHPMVRSGLILAGANHAWAGNPVPEGQEDGILTAYEISRMNLSNTELVVLSACETGLGDIQGNEGVYGLQRAFKIAGAKYILMSLWQVPDQATQELMVVFYEKWLGGMEIRAALQEAQKQIRQKYKEPYYWAGFVLVE
ncbi:MAG: CHAT domain-containing tetratricopeptide repeat protein [Bacteroidota bacterium]